MYTSRKWCILVLSATFFMLLCLGGITIMIDPFFHYHAPLNSLQYPIDNERYQNDGIMKHFEYNAIITGTSMAENFKTSEFDDIFNVNSIKVPFAGASYKEINDNIEKAISTNSNIKIIVRCLDYSRLLDEKNAMRYSTDFYPTYLYDNLLYNDVQYLLNKSVLLDNTLRVWEYTRNGGLTTTFDEYQNWMGAYASKDVPWTASYVRPEKSSETMYITETDYQNIRENISQNITDLAYQNPEIEFYLFFSPYSIYYWDSLQQTGALEKQLQAEKYVIELLLQYDNIHLFSFFDNFELICDSNNYEDFLHYNESINSQILYWIHSGDYLLTKENYINYYTTICSFYTSYDYNSLYDDLNVGQY